MTSVSKSSLELEFGNEHKSKIKEKSDNRIVCAFCNKSFKFHSTLRQHEQIHYGIKRQECEICHQRFLHKSTLKCHLRLHTGETPYQCPHCPKAFRGQTALNCHVFHHTKKGAKCPKCPMVFATSSIVKQHLKQVHIEERSHICNICGMTYKHLKSLRIHLRDHQKRVCPECGTGFDSVYAMQKHRKRHIEERLHFKCGFCNRAFENKNELDGHERLRGRPFQCEICCHSFNKQIYLRNHNHRVHWKAMGLEQLKVAEPKNGWNRKGVPKSSLKKLIVPSLKEGSDLSSDLAKLSKDKMKCHINEKTPKAALTVDAPIKHFSNPDFQQNSTVEGVKLTELILVEDKSLEDLELNGSDEKSSSNIFENPLDMENPKNEKVQVQKRKRFRINNVKVTSEADKDEQHAGFACLLCGFLCNENVALKKHKCEVKKLKKADSAQALICELCGNWYASPTTLAIHRTNQHHTQRFQCGQCNRTFGFRCYLEKHISTHHLNKRQACELCDKSFKYVQDLKVHMRHHDDSKPFKCEQCPSAFRFPSALRSHRILHLHEFPFECVICGKKFRFNNSLRVHKRLHSGIKQFQCDICKREFSTKAPLMRHMKVHNNGKQLSCVVCDSVFYKKVDLAIHESKEHPKNTILGKGTTIYRCEHCGKEFIKKSNLKAHSSIHEKVCRSPAVVENNKKKPS